MAEYQRSYRDAHSQNSENEVNYKREEYFYLQPALELLEHMYNSLYRVKEIYLPKFPLEPVKPYENRLARSVVNNLTRPIIDSNAGLLTAFEEESMPPSLEMAIEDVDLKGSDLKTFFLAANILALRDRLCYVLTLQDEAEEGRTLADEQANPRRPYWKLIDRRNVLNWRTVVVQGEEIIRQLTIREYTDKDFGLYGVEKKITYHFLQLVEGGVLHQIFEEDDEKKIIPVGSTIIPIPRIPITPYFESNKPFSTVLPEFYKTASLNIKLFFDESILGEINRQVNTPTPWRRSRMPVNERPTFVLGGNHVIELYAGDDINNDDEVGVMELEGGGIEQLRASIQDTKEAIQAESLGFLIGSRVDRTATEVNISSAEVSSSLNGKARSMQSAAQDMVSNWCLFTGESPEGFDIKMDQSVLAQPLDAQKVTAFLNMWTEGAIDHETFLQLLKQGKQLPPSTDVSEILRKVKSEQKSLIAELKNTNAQQAVNNNGVTYAANNR